MHLVGLQVCATCSRQTKTLYKEFDLILTCKVKFPILAHQLPISDMYI